MPCLFHDDAADTYGDDEFDEDIDNLLLHSPNYSSLYTPSNNSYSHGMTCSTPIRKQRRHYRSGRHAEYLADCSSSLCLSAHMLSMTLSSDIDGHHNDQSMVTDYSTSFDESFTQAQIELKRFQRLSDTRNKLIARAIDRFYNTDDSDDGLLEKWEVIEKRTDEHEKLSLIQKDIVRLRDQLENINSKMPNMATDLEDKAQVETNICILKGELSNLKEKKALVKRLNVDAHELMSKSKYPLPTLKNDVNDLYRVWQETYHRVSEQLTSLQQTLSTWQHFELHLAELQTALHGDQHTLHMLDFALEHGTFTSDFATSVRDIAKILSDKPHDASLKVNNNNTSTTTTTTIDGVGYYGNTSFSTFSIEGSLSDSGISDSGSEHDLSEREKRLTNLKKLARHLESVLAPSSVALINIMKRIEDTEKELRELQQTCRNLFAKTTVSTAERKVTSLDKKVLESVVSSIKANIPVDTADSSSKGSDPSKRRSFLWRIIRAALPFHMAIMVLFCVACLLEPHCCDTLNTFNFSFLPQLRYSDGPPPT